jgi:protein TonB
MDLKKILNSDYLDILFDGKNKNYGSYELRKKYQKRASLAALIVVGSLAVGLGATLIKPKEEYVPPPPPPPIEDVVLTDPPPIEEDAPPPPELPAAPAPPARATVIFDVPKIAKNEEVRETERIEDPNKEENKDKDIGFENKEGDNSAKDFSNPFDGVPGGTGTAVAGEGTDFGNEIQTTVDVKAKPPAGWQTTIQKNLRYPEMAKAEEIQGRVMVSFVVEKDGSISSVKVEGKDPGGGLGSEAVRVVKTLPAFTPAMKSGKPVRAYFKLPISFSLNN